MFSPVKGTRYKATHFAGFIVRVRRGKALRTMLSRQQAGETLAIVLAGGCAHLKIWYTNGITSVCLWHQEQRRNMQERLCSPCQAVHLSQVWVMGGREEIKHSYQNN